MFGFYSLIYMKSLAPRGSHLAEGHSLKDACSRRKSRKLDRVDVFEATLFFSTKVSHEVAPYVEHTMTIIPILSVAGAKRAKLDRCVTIVASFYHL